MPNSEYYDAAKIVLTMDVTHEGVMSAEGLADAAWAVAADVLKGTGLVVEVWGGCSTGHDRPLSTREALVEA